MLTNVIMIKKYNKKSYPRRKRSFKKQPGLIERGIGVAQKAYKIAKFVAGAINVEYKYFLGGSSLSVITWNGSIISLIDPAQGVTALQRTGDSIKLKDLVVRGEWTRNTGGLTTETCRVIVFIDKQGLVSNVSDLLRVTGTYGSVYSGKNEDNRYTTKILYDKEFIVNNNNFQTRKFNIDLKKMDHHIHFVAGSTTVRTGEVKFALITQSPVNGSQFTYVSRMSYVDN